jgi:hypothetical protein
MLPSVPEMPPMAVPARVRASTSLCDDRHGFGHACPAVAATASRFVQSTEPTEARPPPSLATLACAVLIVPRRSPSNGTKAAGDCFQAGFDAARSRPSGSGRRFDRAGQCWPAKLLPATPVHSRRGRSCNRTAKAAWRMTLAVSAIVSSDLIDQRAFSKEVVRVHDDAND